LKPQALRQENLNFSNHNLHPWFVSMNHCWHILTYIFISQLNMKKGINVNINLE
jgi:hypothetical protein